MDFCRLANGFRLVFQALTVKQEDKVGGCGQRKTVRMRRLNRPTVLLTVAYIIGLAVIGAMSITAHALLGAVIEEQSDEGHVLSVVGRQRMLVQRIAYLSERILRNPAAAQKKALMQAITEMDMAHHAMIEGDSAMGFPKTVPETVSEVLFAQPHELDRRVGTFLTFARFFSNEATVPKFSDDPAFQFIRAEADGPLLESFEVLVEAYGAHFLLLTDELVQLQRIILAVVILTLLAEGVLIFRPLVKRVHLYATRLQTMALSDPMTGVGNRRAFHDAAERELSVCDRKTVPLGLALLDIDKFKRINDTHGHAIGDEAIIHLCAVVKDTIRRNDILCRLGGEEFAVLLPGADAAETWQVAERMRVAVETQALILQNGQTLPFTTSIGCAVYLPGSGQSPVEADDSRVIDGLLVEADTALYRAKENGRNQVCGSEERLTAIA